MRDATRWKVGKVPYGGYFPGAFEILFCAQMSKPPASPPAGLVIVLSFQHLDLGVARRRHFICSW